MRSLIRDGRPLGATLIFVHCRVARQSGLWTLPLASREAESSVLGWRLVRTSFLPMRMTWLISC